MNIPTLDSCEAGNYFFSKKYFKMMILDFILVVLVLICSLIGPPSKEIFNKDNKVGD